MKAYINNIPFDVEGYTNGINRDIEKDFSRYLGNTTLLFTTSSKNLDSVRNWYQNYKRLINYDTFNIAYPNGLVMFTSCYPEDWGYNSITGLVEIEMKVRHFVFDAKYYQKEERKEKLQKIANENR